MRLRGYSKEWPFAVKPLQVFARGILIDMPASRALRNEMERLGLDHTKAYTQHQLNEAYAAHQAAQLALQVVPVAEPVGGSFPETATVAPLTSDATVKETVLEPVTPSPTAAPDQSLTDVEQQPAAAPPVLVETATEAGLRVDAAPVTDAVALGTDSQTSHTDELAVAAPDAADVPAAASSKKGKKNVAKKSD